MYRTSITRWRDTAFRAALLTGLSVLAACGEPPPPGPTVTQTREVGDFQSIDLRGAAVVDIQVGPAASLKLVGGANRLERIETRVQGGRLVIDQNSSWMDWNHSDRVEIHLTLPQLRALSVSGAGNVVVNGLAGGDLRVSLQGAGNLEGTGSLDKVNASINGACNMDFSRVVARDATVVVNGAGSLDVHATGSLDATVNGVGSIHYAGKPADVQTRINGVGRISPR